ncbi:MAG: hypothetical protein EWV54_08990 [Microcystis novacekii Mn_MB_F_20050700_S1D]|uniref:Uncharacterized protein n=1 Tax=Microcystis novacekii Mn_MB_F_20050700_S1D TaxID=2486266 RepID=A0A552J092_9CHRO|nr:MAG: hypothetical protein EWV54_08990 [Microcystis novacekii Mn_MB_F_20050700_S1D]
MTLRVRNVGCNPTLGYIAGLAGNPRIKSTAGTGISEYSQLLAKDIVTYQDRIAVKEQNLREFLELCVVCCFSRLVSSISF